MTTTVIELALTTGDKLEVEAQVIGQLAIHDSEEYVTGAMVSHIKTGALIAEFIYRDDAIEFATFATAKMDFDAYTQMIATSGVKVAKKQYAAAISEIQKVRSGYHSYILESMSGQAMTRKAIKERMQS